MTKRLLLISALVFLAAVGVAPRFGPLSARAANTVTALLPIRSFKIQGVDGLRLNDIETYNGDLYLLLSDGSGLNEILHMTAAGKTVKTIPLPLPSARQKQYSHLRINRSGTMAVSCCHIGAAPLTTVSLYDTDGVSKTSFDVVLFNEIAFISDDLVGIGPNGVTQLTSQLRSVPNAPLQRSGEPWTYNGTAQPSRVSVGTVRLTRSTPIRPARVRERVGAVAATKSQYGPCLRKRPL